MSLPPDINYFVSAQDPNRAPRSIVDQILAAHTQVIDTICLPTQVIVTEPKTIVPSTARVFWTPWAVEKDQVIHVGYSPKSSDPVLLIEVWVDNGDPGRVCFTQIGWRFVRESEFARARVEKKVAARWSALIDFIGRRPEDAL